MKLIIRWRRARRALPLLKLDVYPAPAAPTAEEYPAWSVQGVSRRRPAPRHRVARVAAAEYVEVAAAPNEGLAWFKPRRPARRDTEYRRLKPAPQVEHPPTPPAYYWGWYPGSAMAPTLRARKTRWRHITVPEFNDWPAPAAALGDGTIVSRYFAPSSSVTIALYDDNDNAVSLTYAGCFESSAYPGLFRWDTSHLAAQPTGETHYSFVMTDGVNPEAGDIYMGDSTRLVELWQRKGLDEDNPVKFNTDGSIEIGPDGSPIITIDAETNGDGSITQTRQP